MDIGRTSEKKHEKCKERERRLKVKEAWFRCEKTLNGSRVIFKEAYSKYNLIFII